MNKDTKTTENDEQEIRSLPIWNLVKCEFNTTIEFILKSINRKNFREKAVDLWMGESYERLNTVFGTVKLLKYINNELKKHPKLSSMPTSYLKVRRKNTDRPVITVRLHCNPEELAINALNNTTEAAIKNLDGPTPAGVVVVRDVNEMTCIADFEMHLKHKKWDPTKVICCLKKSDIWIWFDKTIPQAIVLYGPIVAGDTDDENLKELSKYTLEFLQDY